MFRSVRTGIMVVGTLLAGTVFADWDSNPSFELPLGNGWEAYPVTNATTIGTSTSEAFTGLSSLQFVTEDLSGEITDEALTDPKFRYTVVDSLFNASGAAGTEWTASTYYYLPQDLKNGENLGIGIFWLYDAGGFLAYSTNNAGSYFDLSDGSGGVGTPAVVGTWTPISHTETVPADAQFMMIALEVVGDGSTFYFDDVLVVPEPSSILLVGMGLGIFALARRRRTGPRSSTSGFIALGMVLCAVQIGVATAQAESPPKQLSKELAAAIAEIEANFEDADERFQRIALLISRATRSDPMGSASVLADLSSQVSAQSLPVVSAAAIMSAGTRSPTVLTAMVDAQGDDLTRTESVRSGATNPASVLGTETASLMQPVELAPIAPMAPTVFEPVEVVSAPVAQPQPVVATDDAPLEHTESAGLDERVTFQALGPPPPQPSGLPPRPPALPYRGQL